MNLTDAYEMVYDDMINSGCGLLIGKYDARHGNENFMYGISMVMEWIAYRVCEAEGDYFSDKFINNMIESEENK